MNIICIGHIGWDYLWQRPQQIMSRLAVNNNVLYIEEPKSIISFINGKNFSLIKKHKNVLVYTPIGLPFGLHKKPIFNKINFFITYLFLRNIIQKYNFENSILWFYNVQLSDLIQKINSKLIIYDCADELKAFTGSTKEVETEELKLIKLSHIVFASSDKLYKNKRKYSNHVYLIKNGVDVDHFIITNETLENEEILKIKKPIVGYIGAIWDWVDLDLIAFLARERPEISIVLIGPVNTDISIIKNLNNVFIIGKRHYEVLPNYIKSFDVCIIPFLINELTENADPIKLYEYMATGKTIVSTDLPEAKKFSCIKIAKNYNEFVEYITESIQIQRNNGEVKNQIDLAKKNSWDKKVKKIEKVINNKLKS